MAAATPANTVRVRGLMPIGTLSGSDYHGKARRVCFLASDNTATFIGDLVKLTAAASADGTVPAVAQAAAGDICVGVLQSLEPDTTDEGSLSRSNYRRASTLRYGQVLWGPDVLYACQEDADADVLVATDAGTNINVIVGSGSTTTGLSAMKLDSSSSGTSNALHLRLHNVYPRVGNAIGDYAEWVVSINLSDDTATTGVS